MSTYFSAFPEFRYDGSSREQKVREFDRLQAIRGCLPSSPEFREQYRAFRTALVKEIGEPVNQFFQSEPRFNYRSSASPWDEFKRLMAYRRLAQHSDEYLCAKTQFAEVFSHAFTRQIDYFFGKFLDFGYNPHAEAKSEFNRLRGYKKWYFPKGQVWNPQYRAEYEKFRKAREEFFNAFIDDFSFFFGAGDDMRDWEYLCDVLEVQPQPHTIEACKVALESYYINIFDLYNHVQRDCQTALRYHASRQGLANYSHNNGLLFPLYRAKTTCMKVLLRQLDRQEGDGMPAPLSGGWSGEIKIDKRRRRSTAGGNQPS